MHIKALTTTLRLTAFGAATLLAAGYAEAAGVTFAQYNQVDGAAQQWAITVTSTVTAACPAPPCTVVSATGTVDFTFSGVPGAPGGPLVANFLLSAMSTTSGTTGTTNYSESGFSGTFSFLDPALPMGQQNLLSGIFQFINTGAQFNESIGGTGGGFGASDTAINLNEIVMTSSYINFIGQTLQTSTFTLSSLIPAFTAGGTPDMPTGGPYAAAGVGTFSSNPGFAPEPGSIFLIGGGLVGLGVFGRKKLGARS